MRVASPLRASRRAAAAMQMMGLARHAFCLRVPGCPKLECVERGIIGEWPPRHGRTTGAGAPKAASAERAPAKRWGAREESCSRAR